MKSGKIMSIIVSLVMCLMAVPMNTAATKTESSSARAMGDVDDDKKIAASDAALVLSEYGRLSMGSEGIFSEDVRTAADVDKDDKITAFDASLILAYYAYNSAGGSKSIEDYVSEFISGEVTTTSTTTTTVTTTTSTTTKKKTTTTSTTTTSTTTKKKTTTSSATTTTTTTTSEPTTTSTTSTTTTITSEPTTTSTTTTYADPYTVAEIKLDKYEMNLEIDGHDIAYVTILPETAKDKREIWSSSDERVAIVDNEGYVTAIGEGKCIITVKSTANPDVFAEIVVRVTDSHKITDIKLDKYEMELEVGKNDIAYVTMYPETAKDKREIWSSSDESVAVVDDEGYVTAMGEGKCIITVKSTANPDVYEEIVVRVTDSNKITSIELSKTEIVIDVGGHDIAYVTMYPETAQDKSEIWSSSDESIAIVDDEGYITGIGVGVCIITVRSAAYPDVKARIIVEVTE
ncbi:MAG: Ig-like domain-containing protein [Ruminococcus sp.]|nr:Ig-like domain-containing protein [Ruminococcus sp.]